MGTLVGSHDMWDNTHPHPQDGQTHPRPDMSGSGSNSGEAAGSTLGGNDYHGSPSAMTASGGTSHPGMAAPEPKTAHIADAGAINARARGSISGMGTPIPLGEQLQAQHQAQSEQIADAATEKSDLAENKARRAEELKEAVAKQQRSVKPPK